MKSLIDFVNEKLNVDKNYNINTEVIMTIENIYADKSLKKYFTWSGGVNFSYLLEDIIDEHIGDDNETYDECIEELKMMFNKNHKLMKLESDIIIDRDNQYFNWWYGEDDLPEKVQELFNYDFSNFEVMDLTFDELSDLGIRIIDFGEYVLVNGYCYDIEATAVLILKKK